MISLLQLRVLGVLLNTRKDVKMHSVYSSSALIISQNCFIHIYVLQDAFLFKYFASANTLCIPLSLIQLLLLLLLLLLFYYY
jgi:hypothetical protein